MTKAAGGLFLLVPFVLSCQSVARFDTKDGSAYCGLIVAGQFIRTPASEGGFDRNVRLRLEIDADHLTTAPGTLTTNDAEGGPCAPQATFADSPLRVTPEVVHDTLSLMTFEDGQTENVIAWVDSTCRGPMLAIVSLLKTDRVDVRLLKPGIAGSETARDAFGLFSLDRADNGCGF